VGGAIAPPIFVDLSLYTSLYLYNVLVNKFSLQGPQSAGHKKVSHALGRFRLKAEEAD
jgi:hypothetical protein